MARTKQQQDKYARTKGLKEVRRRRRRQNLNKNKPLGVTIRKRQRVPRTESSHYSYQK